MSDKKSRWEVIVGNVGTVYDGENGFEARKQYNQYVTISKSMNGRAGGESVYLMRDGEPELEHIGPVDQEEE